MVTDVKTSFALRTLVKIAEHAQVGENRDLNFWRNSQSMVFDY